MTLPVEILLNVSKIDKIEIKKQDRIDVLRARALFYYFYAFGAKVIRLWFYVWTSTRYLFVLSYAF